MRHKYKDDPWEYSSVTTIIGDCTDKSVALTQWAANETVAYIRKHCDLLQGMDDKHNYYDVPEYILNDARFNFRNISQDALDIGSEVHSAIEYYLKTGKEPKIEHDKVLAGFVAFLEWKDEHQLLPLALEETVLGPYYGGMLDYRGMFDGKEYVIDFKTSKAFYLNEMGPQIAAYRATFGFNKYGLVIENPVVGSGILRLCKETGMPEWKDTSKRYESDLITFGHMVRLYYSRHPRLAKKAGWKGE